MGVKLLTDDKNAMIFRKDKEWSGGTFPVYSMGVSSKDKDGNFVNGYLNVQFKKGTDIPNKSKIKINNAFPVVREWNGNKNVEWFINDYEMVEAGVGSSTSNNGAAPDMNSFLNVREDDLPFALPTR